MNKQRQLSLVIEPMFDDFSVNGAVGLRERQYRTPASLAAMASLGNAASELNDDLRFHQVAEWFGDEFDGPIAPNRYPPRSSCRPAHAPAPATG